MAEARRYGVVAVEPDGRLRNKLALQLANSVDTIHESVDEAMDELDPDRPNVIVFGSSMSGDDGLAVAQKISRLRPDVGVVMLVEELTTDNLQAALRAGVRDAVVLDAEGAQARAAISRAGDTMVGLMIRERAAADADEPGRLVVAFSTKGGVGKSTIATNVAVSLAQQTDESVVILDADLQFGDVAVLLGVPPRHTSADAASAIDTLDGTLLDEILGVHGPSGLRVLPAPIEPQAAAMISPEMVLTIVDALRREYRWVIVDMPPYMDDLVLALLEASDDVLLVASMDIPSIKNLKVGIQTIDLITVAGDRTHLVLNRANARVNLDVADVERAVGMDAEFKIPSDIAVPQSVNRGVPVVIDKPRSSAAEALTEIARMLAGMAPRQVQPGQDSGARRFPWRR